MSHLGLPDQCDTADNMEVSSTERLTSDVPVINEYNKTYTPRMARQAAEPMAHSGQNNEVSESRGIWASAQPQHQVSDSVPAMCNMVLMTHAALMTSKINMQEQYMYEESSEGEDFLISIRHRMGKCDLQHQRPCTYC